MVAGYVPNLSGEREGGGRRNRASLPAWSPAGRGCKLMLDAETVQFTAGCSVLDVNGTS